VDQEQAAQHECHTWTSLPGDAECHRHNLRWNYTLRTLGHSPSKASDPGGSAARAPGILPVPRDSQLISFNRVGIAQNWTTPCRRAVAPGIAVRRVLGRGCANRVANSSSEARVAAAPARVGHSGVEPCAGAEVSGRLPRRGRGEAAQRSTSAASSPRKLLRRAAAEVPTGKQRRSPGATEISDNSLIGNVLAG
jgi:hypothetical protein